MVDFLVQAKNIKILSLTITQNTEFDVQEEKLELQPEFERKLAKRIKIAGKTGELNFMMEGLKYFPMGVFQEEVRSEGLP